MENERKALTEVWKAEGSVKEVQEEEVRKALDKMKRGKAYGPSEVVVEIVKVLRTEGVK